MRPAVQVWIVTLICTLSLSAPATAQDEEQRYELSNVDVEIAVRPDGTYEVAETLTYDFQQGRFSYAYRVLDDEDVTAIRDVRVTSPDVAVDSVGRTAEDGDVRVRWTYPERSAPATFRVQYTVEGALFERGPRNVVHRDVLEEGATVPTRDVDVRVTLPAAFDLTPDSVSIDPADEGTVERSAGSVVATFQRDGVEAGDEYPVEVSFPRRLAGQYWPTTSDLLLGVALFLFGAGGGLVLNLRWKGSRAERDATRPPRDVLIPTAAVLLEKTATPLFTAVLFDLARRGHLTLRHDEESSWTGTTDVVRIDLHPTPGDLSAFESALVERLDEHETVEDFWRNDRSFRQEQYGAVRERVLGAGWMQAHRRRSNWCFAGAVVLLLGALGVGVVMSGLTTVLAVGGGLGGGIGALLAGGRRYTFTQAGAQRASALRSFLDHEKEAIDRLRDSSPTRATERLADALPWLMYHDDVSSAWLEELKAALTDAPTAPDLPDGFASLATPGNEPGPVAAFLPIVSVMGAVESSGAGAAGAAAGGAAGAAGGGGAAGAG